MGCSAQGRSRARVLRTLAADGGARPHRAERGGHGEGAGPGQEAEKRDARDHAHPCLPRVRQRLCTSSTKIVPRQKLCVAMAQSEASSSDRGVHRCLRMASETLSSLLLLSSIALMVLRPPAPPAPLALCTPPPRPHPLTLVCASRLAASCSTSGSGATRRRGTRCRGTSTWCLSSARRPLSATRLAFWARARAASACSPSRLASCCLRCCWRARSRSCSCTTRRLSTRKCARPATPRACSESTTSSRTRLPTPVVPAPPGLHPPGAAATPPPPPPPSPPCWVVSSMLHRVHPPRATYLPRPPRPAGVTVAAVGGAQSLAMLLLLFLRRSTRLLYNNTQDVDAIFWDRGGLRRTLLEEQEWRNSRDDFEERRCTLSAAFSVSLSLSLSPPLPLPPPGIDGLLTPLNGPLALAP